MNGFWDRLGISTSILCMLHCLLTPLLVIFIPVLGQYFSHEWFHAVIAVVVIPVAVWALWNGYRLHKNKRVLWLGTPGIIIVCLAMFTGIHDLRYEFALMLVAGLLLTSAHYINLRSCQAHR